MNTRNLLAAFGLITGLSAYSQAAIVCNGVDPCVNPAAATQTTLTLNASSVLGISATNSSGSDANATSANYYFALTTNNGLGNQTNTITNSGDGTTVVGASPAHPGSATPGNVLTTGQVQGTKGNTSYWAYAQACPSGKPANDGTCSQWVKVSASQITTAQYATSVFANPVKPTDASINSINIRTSVPNGDLFNVSNISYKIIDLITPANSMSSPGTIGFGNSNANPYPVTGYSFEPNVKYNYQAQVQYPWDFVPVAGVQTVGPFWTTPSQPGAVSVSNITHCSVQITAQNSSGAANPGYTEYSLCAGSVCGTSSRINANPSVSVTVNGLNFNTPYTPNATALVGNQDGSQTGWNSSQVKNGSQFTTLDWGNTNPLSISGRTTNSATLTISGVIMSAGDSWTLTLSGGPGSASQTSGTGSLPGTISLTGLNANTRYTVQLHLVDASGASCSNDLPQTPLGFYTLPAAPTAGSFGTLTSRTIPTNWTDGSSNPNTQTTYHLQYSSNGGSTWTDFGTNPAKVAGSAQSGTITGLTPETTYNVRVKTIAASGSPADDSTYFQIPGTALTLNEAPTVSNVSVTVHPTTADLSATATDNDAASHLVYVWAVTAAPSGANYSFTANNTTGASASTTLNFDKTGTYSGTLTVYDHDHDGSPVMMSTQKTWSTNATQIPTSVVVTPSGTTTVGTGNTVQYTATVYDQATPAQVISPTPAITWSIDSPDGGNSITAGGLFQANGNTGNFTVRARVQSDPSVTATAIARVDPTAPTNVNASATVYTSSVALTASATAFGGHSLTYTWSILNSPGGVTIDIPTTGASTVTGTLHAAGAYTLRVTVRDTVSGLTSTKDVQFSVSQSLTGIKVMPDNITIKTLQDQVFTAQGLDQFNQNMDLSAVSWTTSGGNVSGSGSTANFNSPSLGQNVKVTALSGGKSGFATVSLISYDISGAHAYPVPYKSTFADKNIHFVSLGSKSKIKIYTTSGRKVFDVEVEADHYDWDVKNKSGESLASGVYFFVIESPEAKKDGKIIIIQ